MAKLSSYPAASNLIAAQIPIVQGGANKIASASLFTQQAFAVDGLTLDTEAAASANAALIQAAIDATASAGGGAVILPAGRIYHTTVTLKSRVRVFGQGMDATESKAPASLNANLWETDGYSGLVGSNSYNGIPYGLGLCDLRINGNRANQSSGSGLATYAMRMLLRNLIILDCKEYGWLSEGWYTVGAANYPREPESRYESVYVENCGTQGIRYRGPSDAFWDGVFVLLNDGKGITFETSAGVYQASSDVGFMHVYANGDTGVEVGANLAVRFGELITESNFGRGLVINGSNCQIGLLQAYTNCRSSGDYAVTVAGSQNFISQAQHRDGGSNCGGIWISGTSNTLGKALIQGDGSGKIGLLVSGGGHNVDAYVNGYTATGGIGVQFGVPGTNFNGGRAGVTAFNNKTNINIGATGSRNILDLNFFANAGQVGLNGSFNANNSELARVAGFDTDTAAVIAYSRPGIAHHLGAFTVAGLPAGAAGYQAYATNGRKSGEGAGAGTGVPVFHDGTAWRTADGATVAA